MSSHEHRARALKVVKMVSAIDRSAINQGFQPWDQAGRIFAASLGWGDDAWAQIARLADVNEPSETTRKLVQAVYKSRAANPGERKRAS
jgi:hypothetical protein